jgi:hypothetical protein
MPQEDYCIDDHVADLVDNQISTLLGKALEAAYEAGVYQGEVNQIGQNEESGPVACLIAIVKDAQIRCPRFEPTPAWIAPRFYDSLIRLLESGELPPEWQP